MNMKKILVLLGTVICLFLLSSCDDGLKIVKATIDKYPNRIVYFAGIDSQLDLSGGVITLYLKDGDKKTYNMDSEKTVIIENIDFSKPGVYQVELSGPLYFAVQVVDRDYINKYIK
jgi:hypothetical protein